MFESDVKVIIKPWGKEAWLELNDMYCFKKIHINSGARSSFQYHKRKKETQYIIEGKAEVLLENNKGEIEKIIMGPGEFFTVVPGKKHRIAALTDLTLLEVSTPEVDDAVRLNDDYGRK